MINPTLDSVYINMMLSKNNETELVYGDAFEHHLKRMWNLRITHPKEESCLVDDYTFLIDFRLNFNYN